MSGLHVSGSVDPDERNSKVLLEIVSLLKKKYILFPKAATKEQ